MEQHLLELTLTATEESHVQGKALQGHTLSLSNEGFGGETYYQ